MKNRGVKDWPWWKVFTTVQPLIKVQLTEEQMRGKNVSSPLSVWYTIPYRLLSIRQLLIHFSNALTATAAQHFLLFVFNVYCITWYFTVLHATLHVTCTPMFCVTGGNTAAEIEAGEGGEREKWAETEHGSIGEQGRCFRLWHCMLGAWRLRLVMELHAFILVKDLIGYLSKNWGDFGVCMTPCVCLCVSRFQTC